MGRKGVPETIVPADVLQKALSDYRAGESLRIVAKRYHYADDTLKRAFRDAGQEIYSRAEMSRIRALALHSSPLWDLSRDRWHQLYWGPDKPSLETLAAWCAQTFERTVCVKHLKTVLRAHGITLRSNAEQLQIDGKKGRRSGACGGGIKPGTLTEEQRRIWSENGRKANLGKRKRRSAVLKQAETTRKRETRICRWCGAEATRRPSEFHEPPERTYCSRRCSTIARAWIRNQGSDAPRPLILQRLLDAVSVTGKGAVYAPYDYLERIGSQFGAGESEIDAAMFRLAEQSE